MSLMTALRMEGLLSLMSCKSAVNFAHFAKFCSVRSFHGAIFRDSRDAARPLPDLFWLSSAWRKSETASGEKCEVEESNQKGKRFCRHTCQAAKHRKLFNIQSFTVNIQSNV